MILIHITVLIYLMFSSLITGSQIESFESFKVVRWYYYFILIFSCFALGGITIFNFFRIHLKRKK